MRPPITALIFTACFSATYGVVVLPQLRASVDRRPPDVAAPVASQVLSGRFELRPGLDVARAGLAGYLERRGYVRVTTSRVGIREYRRTTSSFVIGSDGFGDSLLAGGGTADDPGVDQRDLRLTLRLDRSGRVERILDGSGNELSSAGLEPESLGRFYGERWEDRRPVDLAELPPMLIDAVLVLEDRRFFEHHGLDLHRVAGALMANLGSGRIVQGGSTITQQLAKNLYLKPDRSLIRKGIEAMIALGLEMRLDKQQILEAYLNEIYLGQRGPVSIHGVGAAAEHYFGKDIGELSVGECALIAGLIPGPGLYAPHRKPEVAIARRDRVLEIVLSGGRISERQYHDALAERLELRAPARPSQAAPYFVSHVRRELSPTYGIEHLRRGGLTIATTLDPGLQRIASGAVTDGLKRLETHWPKLDRPFSPLQAALVVLDPRSGEVLAMVGGRDHARSQFNRAVQARRQPGSAFKPIVALAGLSRRPGERPAFTLASLIQDERLEVADPAGVWTPANHDKTFRGAVTVRDAIEQSLNVPMARIGLTVGPRRVVATARRVGIESRLLPVPSIALGSFEVSLLELTRAYSVLATGGVRPQLRSVRAVHGPAAAAFEPGALASERVYGADEAYLVTSALRGVVERGTGRFMRKLGYHGPVAAKTGTTNGYRDGWFVAYTPELVVGAWVGYDDGKNHGLTGAATALPIVTDFLVGALGPDGGSDFRVPDGVDVVEVDPLFAHRGDTDCNAIAEHFLPGTADRGDCRRIIDREQKLRHLPAERVLLERLANLTLY